MIASIAAVVPVEVLGDTAGPSTSLLPIQIETKVGFAKLARSTCVMPPRISAVSVFDVVVGDAVVPLAVGSCTRAPGTPTLLRMSTLNAGSRRSQIVGRAVAETPVGPACVAKFVTGGLHPRPNMIGSAICVPIDRASRTGYEARCVVALIPPAWKP